MSSPSPSKDQFIDSNPILEVREVKSNGSPDQKMWLGKRTMPEAFVTLPEQVIGKIDWPRFRSDA